MYNGYFFILIFSLILTNILPNRSSFYRIDGIDTNLPAPLYTSILPSFSDSAACICIGTIPAAKIAKATTKDIILFSSVLPPNHTSFFSFKFSFHSS